MSAGRFTKGWAVGSPRRLARTLLQQALMMLLPIPASVLPTGGPWGPSTPVVIDGTLFVVVLAGAVLAAVAIALTKVAVQWSHQRVHPARVRRLRTHSA